jgi:ATP-dependent 26S proteasome regulatory subunit
VCPCGVQTVYLPVVGLVPAEELKPGDLVGVNKDNFLVLEKLPTECVAPARCVVCSLSVGGRPRQPVAAVVVARVQL